MRALQIRAAAAVFVLALVLVAGWLLLSPGWAIAMLKQRAEAGLGRVLDVKGGAHLDVSPELSIRLDQASLSGLDDHDGSFLTAKAIRIPVSLGQLVTRSPDLSAITLEQPDFAFLIDDRGRANWSFTPVAAPSALRLDIVDGSMRYFDARNGQSLALKGANLVAGINVEGGIDLTGTAEINGRLARITADLKSLARVHDDGSPLDLSVEGVEGTASFGGRLSTAKVLSLAGPVTITSPDLRAAARWSGLAVAEGDTYKQVSITGALDSAGRAFAIRKARLVLDEAQAEGDIVVDTRGEVPKLQAQLVAERFTLDPFIPASGAKPDDWGSTLLGLELLRDFDVELTLESSAFTYAGLPAFPAHVVLGVAKGRLQASLTTQSGALGDTNLAMVADAALAPPSFAMVLKSDNAEALLAGPGGMPWLKGPTSMSLDVSGTGRTQQEIVGTLKGTAAITNATGILVGPDLKAMLAAVSQRILDGWLAAGSGNTALSTLAATFTIADGIATTSDLRLESPGISVTATGEVDLLRRAVDLKAEPRLVAEGSGTAVSLPVAVAVKGPWGTPRIYPDLKDILTNPTAAFDSLKAMGLPANN